MTTGSLVLAALLSAAQAQPAFDVAELAAYRLTAVVFARFQEAAGSIAAATGRDPRYADAPLVTREIALSDDVVAAASELHRRLVSDPAIVGALNAADLTAREFSMFTISLVAAHLAHGFVEAGVLRRVPPGITADNVAFVGAHRAAVSDVLRRLGIHD